MNLLFIITGSIAAKKCLKILNSLTKNKVIINCIITENAKKIIKPDSIKKKILGKVYFNSSEKKNKMLHINLTRKNQLVVVCPATANIIAKLANGVADDLASSALIANDKQTIIIPAMNVQMWKNPINMKNTSKLQKAGIEFIGPEYGYLSCGEIGLGRLSEEKKIVTKILEKLDNTKKLLGKRCLVTAGPTIERIDPVRYITNFSSGKQGYEIANQLSLAGAKVTLISGPTNIQAPINVKKIKIETANEMEHFVNKFSKVDIAIFAAAVSDIRPKNISKEKLKKEKIFNLSMIKNPDILKKISDKKKLKPKLVIGFAAETKNILKNANKKLNDKGCDWLVLNKINKKNRVFGSDYNKIYILTKNKIEKYKRMTKIKVAKVIVNKIIENFNK